MDAKGAEPGPSTSAPFMPSQIRTAIDRALVTNTRARSTLAVRMKSVASRRDEPQPLNTSSNQPGLSVVNPLDASCEDVLKLLNSIPVPGQPSLTAQELQTSIVPKPSQNKAAQQADERLYQRKIELTRRAVLFDAHRSKGNQFFVAGNLISAIRRYTAALRILCTHHKVLANRCALLVLLGMHQEALADAQTLLGASVTHLLPEFIRLHDEFLSTHTVHTLPSETATHDSGSDEEDYEHHSTPPHSSREISNRTSFVLRKKVKSAPVEAPQASSRLRVSVVLTRVFTTIDSLTKSPSELVELLKEDVMIASEIREGMAFVKGHDINIIRQAIRLERFKPAGPAACLLIPLGELETQSSDIDRKEMIDNGEIPYDVLPLAQPASAPESVYQSAPSVVQSNAEQLHQQHVEQMLQESNVQAAATPKLAEPGKHLEASNQSSSIDVEEQQRLEQQRQQHEHQQIQLHLQRQQQAELQAQLLEQQKQLQEQQRLFAVQMEQQQQQQELQRQQTLSRLESVSASQHRPRVSIVDTSVSMQKLNLEPELNAVSDASSKPSEANEEWTRIKSGQPSEAAAQPESVAEVFSKAVEVAAVSEASSQLPSSSESKSADRSPVLSFLRAATMSPSVLSPGMAVHAEQQPEMPSAELNSSHSESSVAAAPASASRHSTFVPHMQPIEEPVSELIDDEPESQPKTMHQPSELNASMAVDTTQSSSSNQVPVSPAAASAASMPKLSALSKIKAGMSGVLMKQSNFGLSFNDRFVILSLPESDLSINTPQTKATFVRNKISSSRVQIMMPDEWKLLPTMKMWNTAEDSQRIPLGPKYVWYVHGFECGAQVANAAMNRDEEGDDEEAEQQKAATRRYVDHELVVLVSDEPNASHDDLKRITFWCLTSPLTLQRWVSHLLRCCALKNDPIQSIEMFFGSEEDEEPESQGIIGDLVQQNQLVQQANSLPRQATLARQPTLARQSTMSVPTEELDPVALLRMATKTKKLTDLDMAISVGGQTPESDRSTEMKQLMTVAKIVRESLLKRAASVPHPGSQSTEVAPAMHRRTTSASTTSKRSSVDERSKKKEKILDIDSADAKPSMNRKKSSLKVQRSSSRGPDDANRASSRGKDRT